MKSLFCTAAITLTAIVSGCATTDGAVPSINDMLSESTGQSGRACVRKSDIQSYGALENDVISINARHGYYLATVLPGCLNLTTSLGVMFSSDFYDICGQSMNRLITRDGYCTIGKIYEFDNRDQAFATYNAVLEDRKAMKAAQK